MRIKVYVFTPYSMHQICINRGLETYDKDRGQLEDAVTLLINALDG